MSDPGRDTGPYSRGGRSQSDLETGKALELLSDATRRDILRYLASSPEESVSTGTLHDHLRGVTDMPDEELEIRCHHVHLPKLREANAIEYDRRTGEVRYRRNETVERLLDELDDITR